MNICSGNPAENDQCPIKVCSISSSDFPFVSGIIFHTNNNWKTIIMVKNKKVHPPPSFSVKNGKIKVIAAAISQWVKLPSVWPLALTCVGNISAINTQITAPCEKEKNAIKHDR